MVYGISSLLFFKQKHLLKKKKKKPKCKVSFYGFPDNTTYFLRLLDYCRCRLNWVFSLGTKFRLYFSLGSFLLSCAHPVFHIQSYRFMLNKFSLPACTGSLHYKFTSTTIMWPSHANITVQKHRYCHSFTTAMLILSALPG